MTELLLKKPLEEDDFEHSHESFRQAVLKQFSIGAMGTPGGHLDELEVRPSHPFPHPFAVFFLYEEAVQICFLVEGENKRSSPLISSSSAAFSREVYPSCQLYRTTFLAIPRSRHPKTNFFLLLKPFLPRSPPVCPCHRPSCGPTQNLVYINFLFLRNVSHLIISIVKKKILKVHKHFVKHYFLIYIKIILVII